MHRKIQDNQQLPAQATPLYDLVIVGAGPHALNIILRYLEKEDADHSYEFAFGLHSRHHANVGKLREHIFPTNPRKKDLNRVLVVDPAGCWLNVWRTNFEALQIENLRSPSDIHPDPIDSSALVYFAEEKKRAEEIRPITGVKRSKTYDSGVSFPSSAVFSDFCEQMIETYQLNKILKKASATKITPIYNTDQTQVSHYAIELSTGEIVTSSFTVCAIGSTVDCHKQLPFWAEDQYHHNNQLLHCHDLIQLIKAKNAPDVKNKAVLVVGGGLTSGHLSLLALRAGCEKVILICRHCLQVKPFDLDLSWIAAKSRPHKLHQFYALTPEERWKMIQRSRGGGSINPAVMDEMKKYIALGKLEICEDLEIWSADWSSDSTSDSEGCFNVECSDESKKCCHHIWLATGTQVDITQEPLFEEVLKESPIEIVRGFPVVRSDLSWSEKCRGLFVMGRYAAISLGPDALNLAGARMGSCKIVDSLKQLLNET
jgi:lysine/ornithine N-monooxygenase